MDVDAACITTYRAANDSGSRLPSVVRWVVIHDTEGPVGIGAARSVAAYFARIDTPASTHLVVDDQTCYRCLPNHVIPWGARSAPWIKANTRGFHIELCGYAKWSRNEWMQHAGTLERAAYKTALHCRLFSLPLRWVGPAGLVAGRQGITTHRDVSVASKLVGGHSDPGPNFPKDRFLGLVQMYAQRIEA